MAFSRKAVSQVLKFIAIAVVSGFCVLAADQYYKIEKYARDLLPALSFTVFIDKNSTDDSAVCDAVEKTGFFTIDEYVNSKDAYNKAVEKNPFLKDVSVPGDSEIFQSYIKLSPSSLPDEGYLSAAVSAVSALSNISETVFNPEKFKEYARVKNLMGFYAKLLLVFAAAVFVLFAVQSAVFITEHEDALRKYITNFAICLISSSLGFAVAWGICVFAQHTLLIGQTAAFYIIPATAAFGIILKD